MLVHRAMVLSPSIENSSMYNSSNYGVITNLIIYFIYNLYYLSNFRIILTILYNL